MVIQYVATIIIVVIMIQLLIKLLRDRIAFFKIAVSLAFWALALFVVWFPNVIWQIGQVSGVGRGVDVLIYISIIFLFYFLFSQNSKIDLLNKQVTKLTRELAKRNDKTR